MRWILILTSSLLMSSCVVPHRDVMVFGTDTSFGLSVGADPASAQVTNVTIGYKRREAVFMPLLVNGQDSRVFCQEMNPDGKTCKVPPTSPTVGENWSPKYNSSSQGVDPKVGGKDEERDTYSVFASFGGDASAATGKGRIAIAQFFATGVAAQRLGANPSAAQLVSTVPEVDAEGERAKGKVEAWKELGVADAARHKANTDAGNASNVDRRADDVRIADYVFAAASPAERQTRLDKLLTGVEEFPELYRGRLEGSLGDRSSFEKVLAGGFNDRNAEIAGNIPPSSN